MRLKRVFYKPAFFVGLGYNDQAKKMVLDPLGLYSSTAVAGVKFNMIYSSAEITYH